VLRFISSLLVPAILLGLVYFLYPKLALLSNDQVTAIKFLPIALTGVLLLLCLHFNRSRLFFASVNMLLLYSLLNWGLPKLATTQMDLMYALLCLLMLITLLIMNGRLFAQPTAQRGALFGSLLALLGVLHFKDALLVGSLLTNAALLMFVIALIQESWNMAYIDHLTGLPGRRALNDRLLKLSGTYSIAMMDIDHFKKFNDRYGGEEFTIVFPGRAINEVMDSLEGIRERVAASPFHPTRKERRKGAKKKGSRGSRGVKVTISIGVSERNERFPLPADVIKGADKALYRAKKKGRNQVCK